nr:GNAT family N-acetyltransferase [Zhihengliuella flava]
MQAAQNAEADWQRALALATGGKVFSTHGCDWAWQPARRRLVLLFPSAATEAGLRPGLAEGTRLGAQRVDALVNAAAADRELQAAGFRDSAQLLWYVGSPHPTDLTSAATGWQGRARVSLDVPEATGVDAAELRVASAWKEPHPASGRRPDAAARRIEHVTARRADRTLVGRGFAQFTVDGAISLHSLAVAAEARRQGVGQRMVAALVEALTAPVAVDAEPDASRPLPRVVAAGTPQSAAFFSACGLEHLGRGRRLRLA